MACGASSWFREFATISRARGTGGGGIWRFKLPINMSDEAPWETQTLSCVELAPLLHTDAMSRILRLRPQRLPVCSLRKYCGCLEIWNGLVSWRCCHLPNG